jgi:hypothetical protein
MKSTQCHEKSQESTPAQRILQRRAVLDLRNTRIYQDIIIRLMILEDTTFN